MRSFVKKSLRNMCPGADENVPKSEGGAMVLDEHRLRIFVNLIFTKSTENTAAEIWATINVGPGFFTQASITAMLPKLVLCTPAGSTFLPAPPPDPLAPRHLPVTARHLPVAYP